MATVVTTPETRRGPHRVPVGVPPPKPVGDPPRNPVGSIRRRVKSLKEGEERETAPLSEMGMKMTNEDFGTVEMTTEEKRLAAFQGLVRSLVKYAKDLPPQYWEVEVMSSLLELGRAMGLDVTGVDCRRYMADMNADTIKTREEG